MSLPSDFTQELEAFERRGILGLNQHEIYQRLTEALQKEAGPAGLIPSDLGPLEWARDCIRKIITAIHQEICDTNKGQVQEKYEKLLDKASETDSISIIASVVTQAIAAIHPMFVVSNIVIYLALWLVKIGLNVWCKYPPSVPA